MKKLALLILLCVSNVSMAAEYSTVMAIWTAPKKSVQRFVLAGHDFVCKRSEYGSVKCVVMNKKNREKYSLHE